MDSIRDKYKLYGVKNFYQFHSGEYSNPHEDAIDKSIKYVYENWDLDFSKVLDLMCGDGVVTKCLDRLGVDADGVDGYLSDEYIRKTGRPCRELTFDDIMNGELNDDSYSLVICSYSLHLLEQSKLPIFLYQLSNVTDNLLILSPHKKPEIKTFWELKNEDVIDRVRIRYFQKKIEKEF